MTETEKIRRMEQLLKMCHDALTESALLNQSDARVLVKLDKAMQELGMFPARKVG